jgi:hypothetical protein
LYKEVLRGKSGKLGSVLIDEPRSSFSPPVELLPVSLEKFSELNLVLARFAPCFGSSISRRGAGINWLGAPYLFIDIYPREDNLIIANYGVILFWLPGGVPVKK